MNLADTEKDKQLYGKCDLLPGWDELELLNEGNYIRLKTKDGAFFWALVLKRRDNRFICRLRQSCSSDHFSPCRVVALGEVWFRLNSFSLTT